MGKGKNRKRRSMESTESNSTNHTAPSLSVSTQPVTSYSLPTCHKNKKHWLDYCVFGTAVTAAIATGFAAWFTHQQIGIAEDTAKRQLRAYLSVSAAPNALQNFGEGKIAQVQGKYENMGQTPAYKVKWKSGINVSRNIGTVELAYGACSTIMNDPEGSNGYVTGTPVYPKKNRDKPFTKEEIERIQAGADAIYFSGRVCYLDIYDEIQSVDFCIFWALDLNKGRLDTDGTYCRDGNGPPEMRTT